MKFSDNSYIQIGPEKLKDEAFTHSTNVIVKNSTKPTKRCELNKITKGTTKDNNKCNRKKQCTPTLIKSSSTSACVMKSTKDRNNTELALTSSSNFNHEVIDLCESSEDNFEDLNVNITAVKVNKNRDKKYHLTKEKRNRQLPNVK